MHIADIDLQEFFDDAVKSLGARADFARCLESDRVTSQTALTILRQGSRMLWLADRIDEVARMRPALQILFYMIAAEAVAKLATGFHGEGESRKHAHLFFETYCPQTDQDLLAQGFADPPGLGSGVGLRRSVDYLYEVRCDVVHEGRYFLMSLRDEGADTMMLTPSRRDRDFLVARITLSDLRAVALRGIVTAAKTVLPPGHPCAG